MVALLFVMLFGPGALPDTDWPELVRKLHPDLPVPELGLRPLLLHSDGQPITSRADWDQARQRWSRTWLAQLG